MVPVRGRLVELQTDRFKLRSLKPSDASDRWLGWARDSEVMGPLNAPVSNMTRQDLANYIGTSDNNTRYLIGIFDRVSAIQIGFFMIDVDKIQRRATFNVVIGEKAWWGKGVVNETRGALLDHFFEHRDIQKVCGGPLARNFPAVLNYKAQGWRHEGTLRGQCESVVDGSRIDQYQFGLLRDEWSALQARRTRHD
jgi:[ribosomal protein S5]-alanine N-acetyltransferase